MEAVERGSKLSFYFAHAYYFYINSLEKVITEDEIQVFKKVSDYKHKFLEEMNRLYEGQMLNSVEFFLGEKVKTVPVKSDIGYLIKMYGSKEVYKESSLTVKATDITLPNYSSHFKGFEEPELYSFRSTINFFEDLFIASEELKNYENKKEKLKEYLQEINLKLPASVYVPFTKCKDIVMQSPRSIIMCSISLWKKPEYFLPKRERLFTLLSRYTVRLRAFLKF